jgi:hypothetical protein
VILTLKRTTILFLRTHEIHRKSRDLNEPLKKDLLVDPASNFQTSVCLPKISVNSMTKNATNEQLHILVILLYQLQNGFQNPI